MAAATTEDMSVALQRGFSEWWNEETEYLFQRIERWAAFARGYNRLRSERLSRGRLTMQEEQETRWSISSNKIVIEDPAWSPRFHNLKRSHRRNIRNDENCKINCCGSFNYQSNSNLDSTCLESYRYDHSIYFKTIGDIKSSRKDSSTSQSKTDDTSGLDNQQLELECKTVPGFTDDLNVRAEDDQDDKDVDTNGDGFLPIPEFELNIRDVDEQEDDIMSSVAHSVWPIVDLPKLNRDDSGNNDPDMAYYDPDGKTPDKFIASEIQINVDNNNNDDNYNHNEHSYFSENSGDSTLSPMKNNHEGFTRILSFGKQRRNPRRVSQPKLVGENNVMWPGVLLNYTKNLDPATSPHHHYTIHLEQNVRTVGDGTIALQENTMR